MTAIVMRNRIVSRLSLWLMLSLCLSCSLDPIIPPEAPSQITLPFSGEVDRVQTLGGSGEDSFHSLITTSDGGFAAFGYSNSTDGDLQGKELAVTDYWLVKFDREGEIQWSKTYGGSADDRGQKVIQTADGGYAVTGYAMSSDGDGSNNEGFHDNWILKLDAAGAIEWEHSFGFAGHDHSYDLLQTPDEGFFFVGFLDVTAANGEGNYGKGATSLTRHGVGEFWGTRIDALGNLQWRRFFGGTNNDRAHAVVQASDGGFVLSGFSESDDFDISGTKGSYDFWVIKISDTGSLIWERSFGGTGIEISYDILKTSDDAYVIAGNTFSTDTDVSENHGESDVWLIKISDAGELLWEHTYGGSAFDAAQGVSQTGDGGFLVCGNSKSADGDVSTNQGENDIWLIRTDSEGNLLWEKSLGGTGIDFGFHALETSEKDMILVGETAGPQFEEISTRGDTDAVVVRLNSGIRYRQ